MSNVLPSGKQGHAGFLSKWIGYRKAARTLSLVDSTVGVSNPTPEPNDVVTYLITLKSILDLPIVGQQYTPVITASNGVVSTPTYLAAGEWTFTHTQGIASVTNIDISYNGVAFPTETIEYAVTNVYVPWSTSAPSLITNGLWGHYTAANYSGSTWADDSGNNRVAVRRRGTVNTGTSNNQYGATESFPVIYGNTGTELKWTTAFPSTWTLITVARYNGAEKRIFQNYDKSPNWLSGFWDGKSGVAFHDGWLSGGSNTDRHAANWVISTDQKYLYRSFANNGTVQAQNSGGGGTPKYLSINPSTGDGSASVYAEYSDWMVAEVIIYSRELSSSEIEQMEQHLNAKYGISTNVPKNLMSGDTTLLELQQPLTNRAYVETTAYGGVSVNQTDYKTGYGSLEFSNGGYVELPSTFQVDHTKDFTYETWARCDNHSGYEGIITKWQANQQEFFLGLHTSSRAVMLWRNNSSNTRVDYTSSYVPAIGEWFHLAYTQQGNTSRLFINGVLYQTWTDGQNSGKSSNFRLGNDYYGNELNGKMDNIRISSVARYTSNFTPSTDEFDNDADTLLLINGNESWADQLDAADATVSPPFDVTKSTVSVSNSSPTEGDTVTYTVTVRRGNGETINTNTPAVTASANNGSVSTPAYQGNGVWTFTHSRSTSGSSTITVGYDGTNFPAENITYQSSNTTPDYVVGFANSGRITSRTESNSNIQAGDLIVVQMSFGAGTYSYARQSRDSMNNNGWTQLGYYDHSDTYDGGSYCGYRVATGSSFPINISNSDSDECYAAVYTVFRNWNGIARRGGTDPGHSTATPNPRNITYNDVSGFTGYCVVHATMNNLNQNGTWYINPNGYWTNSWRRHHSSNEYAGVVCGWKRFETGGTNAIALSSHESGISNRAYSDATSHGVQIW